MGLDMYLSVRMYVSRIKWLELGESEESQKFKTLVDLTETGDIVQPDDYAGAYVEMPVYYWRKANAIHKWFVDELADGVDDCRPMELQVNKLQELVERIDLVLKNEDEDDAEEYLPTGSGFFFGSTGYDEYYFGELKRTANDLRKLIAKLRDRSDEPWLIYQASW